MERAAGVEPARHGLEDQLATTAILALVTSGGFPPHLRPGKSGILPYSVTSACRTVLVGRLLDDGHGAGQGSRTPLIPPYHGGVFPRGLGQQGSVVPKLFCGFSHMAVCASYFALSDLFFHKSPRRLATRHVRHISALCPPNVIEGKDENVALPTVNTGVFLEEGNNTRLRVLFGSSVPRRCLS